MKKKKQPYPIRHILLLCILLTIVLVFDRTTGSVLGDRDDDKDDKRGSRGRGGNNNNVVVQVTDALSPTPTISEAVLPVYVTPTQQVTVVLSPSPTFSAPTLPSSEQEPVFDENNNINENVSHVRPSNNDEVIVSVTERSVLNQSQYLKPIATPTRSVLKSIGQKIKNVGSGEFLSSPKPVVTPPMVNTNQENERNVGLDPDSSIFYTLIGDSSVLLGAVDKENKRINVDEVELRGAELTMDKVLRKKGLNLGVSSGDRLVLVDGEANAYFDMPVYVDVFSHDVSLGTVEGSKKVVVMPSQALAALESAQGLVFDSTSMNMEIEYKKSDLSYVIKAKKVYLLFGRYPVYLDKKVFVSAETGDVSFEDDGVLATIIKSASK